MYGDLVSELLSTDDFMINAESMKLVNKITTQEAEGRMVIAIN
jgi:hypothetical protein